MLKAWCMFDNHTFASIEVTTRAEVIKRVRELIDRRRGASFFVHDESDAVMRALDWHSRDKADGIADWVDRLFVEADFKRAMVA